jgi:predicted nucleotide-binding protein
MATKKIEAERMSTQLTIERDLFKEQLIARIRLGEEICNRPIQTNTQLAESWQEHSDWNDYNSELLKQSFNKENNEYKKDYDEVNFFYGLLHDKQRSDIEEFREKTQNKINILKKLIAKVDLIKSENSVPVVVKIIDTPTDNIFNTDVFIVHGHNNEIKINVARTLEKLGLNPIILHEQPNSGKTIVEKFEANSDVGFAIILLTDDDFGTFKKGENVNPRARQNVILELGYFIGKLGRSRVCPLYTKGVELPSDLYGLLYIEIDNSEYWKFSMAKELKAAGYDIDINKII